MTVGPKMKKFSINKTRRPKENTYLDECSDCPALCRNDLTVTILKPDTNKEIEDLMWHLNYDTVAVYIRNRRWHLLIKGRCQYLDKRNLCTIYDKRFDTCRKHRPPHCERYDDWYDTIFLTPFELKEYLDAERSRWRSGAAGKGSSSERSKIRGSKKRSKKTRS
jgi:Fe-S-cluster containining protein